MEFISRRPGWNYSKGNVETKKTADQVSRGGFLGVKGGLLCLIVYLMCVPWGLSRLYDGANMDAAAEEVRGDQWTHLR